MTIISQRYRLESSTKPALKPSTGFFAKALTGFKEREVREEVGPV